MIKIIICTVSVGKLTLNHFSIAVLLIKNFQ